jgi:hypothetical protein
MAVGTVLAILADKNYWLALATGATRHRFGAKGKATSSMVLQSFTVSRSGLAEGSPVRPDATWAAIAVMPSGNVRSERGLVSLAPIVLPPKWNRVVSEQVRQALLQSVFCGVNAGESLKPLIKAMPDWEMNTCCT